MDDPSSTEQVAQAEQAEVAANAFVAYRISPGLDMPIVPATSVREWMLATNQHFANRCLPLLIANQSGWFVMNSHRLRAVWTGGDQPSSLEVEYLEGSPPYPALSHFGYGILTWHLPYLFRTPPGYNLLVRGPANWPKDGIYPLEGAVETDWSVATFTMNWKLTRPDQPVCFDIAEPVCMLVPQRRSELETFQPRLRELIADSQVQRGHQIWSRERSQFLADLKVDGSEAFARGWQKHYFQGRSPDGGAAPQHQTKLKLRSFTEQDT